MTTDLCNLPALVVAPQQRHVGWVACFQQQQQREHFQAVAATVHKVPHEYVAGAGDLTASLKQPQQVMELPMDVTTNLRATWTDSNTAGVCKGTAAGGPRS